MALDIVENYDSIFITYRRSSYADLVLFKNALQDVLKTLPPKKDVAINLINCDFITSREIGIFTWFIREIIQLHSTLHFIASEQVITTLKMLKVQDNDILLFYEKLDDFIANRPSDS